MNAREFCRQDVAPPHSDLATALNGVESDTELALLGTFAFYQRVTEIPHRASERALADMQLQWWRSQLTSEAASTHPSLQALTAIRQQQPSVDGALQQLLDTVASDIEFSGFADQPELDACLQRRGVALVELTCACLRVKLPPELAATLGAFLEYCQLVQDFPRHASAGVVYLPVSELGQHGLSAEQICHHTDADLSGLFAAQTQHQIERLRQSLPTLDATTARTLAPLLVLIALRYRWLIATASDGYAMQRYRLHLGVLQRRQIRLAIKIRLALGRFRV